MKMNRKTLFSMLAVAILAPATAFAGTCEIHVTRTSCPGQEGISFKKCKGEASCSSTKDVASAEDCAAYAAKKCINRRYEITKLKSMSAKFDGTPLKTHGGSDDFCSEDNTAVGYEISKSFPFKDKSECS